MGADGKAVEEDRQRCRRAYDNRNPCHTKHPKERPTVFGWDGMEYLHGISAKTVRELKVDFAHRINTFMHQEAPCCHTFIFGFDQRGLESHSVTKAVHTDAAREKSRQAAAKRRAKKLTEMSEEERAAQVTELDVTSHDENRPLPTDWAGFIMNRENRWRVFQILLQTLLDPAYVRVSLGKLMVIVVPLASSSWKPLLGYQQSR